MATGMEMLAKAMFNLIPKEAWDGVSKNFAGLEQYAKSIDERLARIESNQETILKMLSGRATDGPNSDRTTLRLINGKDHAKADGS